MDWMAAKRMPWDRPPGSLIPNRPGDRDPVPLFTALGRALSAWEGVNAAVDSFFHSLHQDAAEGDKEDALLAYRACPKVHDRAGLVRAAAATFLDADFGIRRDEAARLNRDIKTWLGKYMGWVARRNEIAHGYVTESQSPDYAVETLPLITTYSLLPSHARPDRWFREEPEFNYVAAEIESFASGFGRLDEVFERLAGQVSELSPVRCPRPTP